MMNTITKLIAAVCLVTTFAACTSNKPVEQVDDTLTVDDTGFVDTDNGTETEGLGNSGAGVDQTFIDETPDTIFYFEFDSATLTSRAQEALDQHANLLRATDRVVRLEGHADERGSREYNMALGERRANAVRDYLVAQGVSRANLDAISYGEEQPINTSSSDFAMSKNRRVELK